MRRYIIINKLHHETECRKSEVNRLGLGQYWEKKMATIIAPAMIRDGVYDRQKADKLIVQYLKEQGTSTDNRPHWTECQFYQITQVACWGLTQEEVKELIAPALVREGIYNIKKAYQILEKRRERLNNERLKNRHNESIIEPDDRPIQDLDMTTEEGVKEANRRLPFDRGIVIALLEGAIRMKSNRERTTGKVRR